MFQAEIAHHRADDGAGQSRLLLPVARAGNDVEQLIAVDDAAEMSTITRRSPSPSSAMPACACTPGTVSCNRPGDVEPQLRLMFRPFGEEPMGTISAPRSARMRGPICNQRRLRSRSPA